MLQLFWQQFDNWEKNAEKLIFFWAPHQNFQLLFSNPPTIQVELSVIEIEMIAF